MALEIIILAAGMGKRMKSRVPKVMHTLAGSPLLRHVIDTAASLHPAAIHVVTGHGAAEVEAYLAALPDEVRALIRCVRQTEQLGTAHAVASAMPEVSADAEVLVLYGDTPLTPAETLDAVLKTLSGNDLCVLTAVTANPTGYGRIMRGSTGLLERIVEEKDADAKIRAITEINTGIIAAPAAVLNRCLPRIGCDNAQHEYYLTDLAGLLIADGGRVAVCQADNFDLLQGVNSPQQLAVAERTWQQLQAERLMSAGVRLADPSRLDIRGSLSCGQDVFIDVNCVFIGSVQLGSNVVIGPGCVLQDCTIGDGCVLSPYTVIEGSVVHRQATLGPFCRIRPGCDLGERVHVGNFVEMKKAKVAADTKAGHLSYIGDSQIGERVNIGAGTITCNYDGKHKHETHIGNDVFVGSDTQLVAPVEVPEGVTIGAGTTLTRKTRLTQNDLVITRADARVFHDYPRPGLNRKS